MYLTNWNNRLKQLLDDIGDFLSNETKTLPTQQLHNPHRHHRLHHTRNFNISLSEANTNHDAIHHSRTAFFYIIVVLGFYAFSMILLMVKYIKQEREEAAWQSIFNEYVDRDQFSQAVVQNRIIINQFYNHNKATKNHIMKDYISSHPANQHSSTISGETHLETVRVIAEQDEETAALLQIQ